MSWRGSLAGAVNVAAGATLASGNNITSPTVGSQVGSLIVSSSLTTSGTVSPGDSGGTNDLSTIGQLNVTGNALLGNSGGGNVAAHLSIELGGTNDGTNGGNNTGPLSV